MFSLLACQRLENTCSGVQRLGNITDLMALKCVKKEPLDFWMTSAPHKHLCLSSLTVPPTRLLLRNTLTSTTTLLRQHTETAGFKPFILSTILLITRITNYYHHKTIFIFYC